MNVDNSLWHTNLFKNKKALILVPHEDDELFLAGTVIVELKKMNCSVMVAFSTNGDNGHSADKRITQCLKALKKLGINRSNVFFLGYGDGNVSEYGHLYHAPQNQIVRSKAGHSETYGISGKSDWCYSRNGYHRQYTRNGFLKDIEELLVSLKPDIIFCNDMDWHPDHRALSLAFEKVLGKILKNNWNYAPYVYKGFVYFTAWDASLDFDNVNPVMTKRPPRYKLFNSKYELENPYFFWNDRVRFPVLLSLLSKHDFFNPIFQAIKQYKFSEHAFKYAKGAINSDQIFWQRRTDNLALRADVSVSSGTADYINDFMILDSSNICKTKNILLDSRVWVPEENDDKKYVCIDFHKQKKAEGHLCVYIYRGIEYLNYPCTVKIFKSENFEDKNSLLDIFQLDNNKPVTYLHFYSKFKVDRLYLQFIGRSIGISEIEVYEQNSQTLLPLFIKAQINGNFAYIYHIGNEELLFLNIYQYTISNHAFVRHKVKYRVYGISKEKITIAHNEIKVKKGFVSVYIHFYLEQNPNVYDTIKIVR